MSSLVKTIIVAQALSLTMLAFWLGKEYQNNVYLQQYIRNTTWTYLPILAFIATFSVAVGVSEAYAHVGSRNVGSTAVQPAAGGMLLTGGFQPAQTSSQDSRTPAQEPQGESDGYGPPGVSFAQVFEDSHPPTLLKHVEPDETVVNYAPPAYPVIRRLKPARDPDIREVTKPTPRPLNRVGLAPGFALPSPPVIRQISRPGSGTKRDDALRDRRDTKNEETAQASESSARPRPPKRKPVAADDLGNDFANE